MPFDSNAIGTTSIYTLLAAARQEISGLETVIRHRRFDLRKFFREHCGSRTKESLSLLRGRRHELVLARYLMREARKKLRRLEEWKRSPEAAAFRARRKAIYEEEVAAFLGRE